MASQQGKTIAVSYLGKVKTTVQMLTLALGGAMMVDWVPMDLWGAPWIWSIVLYSTVGITGYTAWEYFYAAASLYTKDM